MKEEKGSRRQSNYKSLIGNFESRVDEQIFELIEQHFQLKKTYSDRDWLNKNREEVP